MAIEKEDPKVREHWTDRARESYYAATDQFPSMGRLYHHLATIARQNYIENLYLYQYVILPAQFAVCELVILQSKSLTVHIIFAGTRESILGFFKNVDEERKNRESMDKRALEAIDNAAPAPGLAQIDAVNFSFVELHEALFCLKSGNAPNPSVSKKIDLFSSLLREVLALSLVAEAGSKDHGHWIARPTHMAICFIGSMYQFGSPEGIFRSFQEPSVTGSVHIDAHSRSKMASEVTQASPPPPTPHLSPASKPVEDSSNNIPDTLLLPGKLADTLQRKHATVMHVQASPPLAPPPPPPPVSKPIEYRSDKIPEQFLLARWLAIDTLQTFLSCNIEHAKITHVQPWLIFLDFFIRHRKELMKTFLEAAIPWQKLIDCINAIYKEIGFDFELNFSEESVFPEIRGASATADDYALRGLVWAHGFYPVGYFNNHPPESNGRSYEHPAGSKGAVDITRLRKERVLYLATRICTSGGYFNYSKTSQEFELDSSLQERLALVRTV